MGQCYLAGKDSKEIEVVMSGMVSPRKITDQRAQYFRRKDLCSVEAAGQDEKTDGEGSLCSVTE